MAGGAHLADDAVDPEAEAVDLKAHLELIADDIVGRVARLDEAAVEAEIEDAAFARVPVVDPELDGAAAGVARGAAAIVGNVPGLLNGSCSAGVAYRSFCNTSSASEADP
jgi:hypothetical protein